ncbi:MAG: hypothetical protein ACKPKO_21055, partial [Candidatus Fonsibacter sp.]
GMGGPCSTIKERTGHGRPVAILSMHGHGRPLQYYQNRHGMPAAVLSSWAWGYDHNTFDWMPDAENEDCKLHGI